MERILKVYGESDKKPELRLEEKDRKRQAYYELYTGNKFVDANNYQLCLDSGNIGLDKCVEIIVDLVKSKIQIK